MHPANPSAPTRRRTGGLLALATALSVVPLTAGVASAAPPPATSATDPDLGVNVKVFDPSMPVGEI